METNRLLVKRFRDGRHHLSALSSKDFSPQFLSQNHENLNLFFFRGDCFATIITCDGLLYLSDYHCCHNLICNPTTQELKLLPTSTVPRPRPNEISSTLFDSFGFGYDSSSDDYKVIRKLQFVFKDDEVDGMMRQNGENILMELYSVRKDSWKKIPISCDAVIRSEGSGSVYLEGNCYWFAEFNDGLGIVSFDFCNESFSVFQEPNSLPDDINKGNTNYVLDLVKYGSSLGFTASQKTGHHKSFHLWVSKLVSRESTAVTVWDKVFSINLNGVRRIVGLNADESLLFLEGTSNSEGICQLLVYNWIKKEMREVDMHDYRGEMKVLSYAETTFTLPGAIPINDGSLDNGAWQRMRFSMSQRTMYIDSAATDSDEEWAGDSASPSYSLPSYSDHGSGSRYSVFDPLGEGEGEK